MGLIERLFKRPTCYNSYPANDYLNSALRWMLRDFDKNEEAIREIYRAILAANGYFTECVERQLEEHDIDVPFENTYRYMVMKGVNKWN